MKSVIRIATLGIAMIPAVILPAQKTDVFRDRPLPSGYQIPPADLPCILAGNRLDLQCILANDPDVKRIRAEAATLEAQALGAARSGNLDPYHQMQVLGALEMFDPNLSVYSNLSCSTCHEPAAGFRNGVSILSVFTGGTNPGSAPITTAGAYPDNRIGKRNTPSLSYATYFPPLVYNQLQQDFYGGNFWDGRATGYKLQSASAEQAGDPPLDPLEMANPDPACVVWKLSQSKYRFFFEQIFGEGSLEMSWPSNVGLVCATPAGAAAFNGNPTPVVLSAIDRTRVMQAYAEFEQAMAAFEASPTISAFSSKFDAYLAGKVQLTPQELAGYQLFRGKAVCNTCHLDGRSNIAGGGTDNGAAANSAPLFTDFTYVNLGLPKNVNLPFYAENTPDQFGFTGNSQGSGFMDLGLGLYLSGTPVNLRWAPLAPQFNGTFQTVSLRNAAMMPYSGFVKAFMHNGYLTSLNEVVHFYNTRDVYAYPVISGQCPPGTIEKVTCWPMPEESSNVDTTVGNLGLSATEENALVAFLETLVDGSRH